MDVKQIGNYWFLFGFESDNQIVIDICKEDPTKSDLPKDNLIMTIKATVPY